MFSLKTITSRSMCRASRSCLDWPVTTSITRVCARLINSTDPGIEEESVVFKKKDNTNNELSNLPLALRFISEDSYTAVSTDKNMFEKTKKEFEETIEDIKFDIENLKTLKTKYEAESKIKKYGNELLPMSQIVGSSDSVHMPSNVPCGGCGALLHCNDSAIPGYTPEEYFKGKTKAELQSVLCRRCILMKRKILKVDIDKKGYAKVLKQIKREIALVLMVVDVTDMANSIIPEFLHGIGKKRPIMIVGNKVDLYPRDDNQYLNRILDRLKSECERASLNPTGDNIKHTCLVSAKTGFGIEELIDTLMVQWGVRGNVYLVGTTNSGKSSLFNRFLNSDYCKHTCRDIAQRATISRWPGTTLNLVKFPIIKPYGWKFGARIERLRQMRFEDVQRRDAKRDKLKNLGKSKHALIQATVGKTEFRKPHLVEEVEKQYEPTGQHFTTFSLNPDGTDYEEQDIKRSKLMVERKTVLHEMYPEAKWACDTPGLVNKSQLINYLTAKELKLLLQRVMIRPRVFVLHPGHVMFITGLARIDYLEGSERTFFTVHTNHNLPVHVVFDTQADDFYKQNINTDTLALPFGSEDRLNHLPSLCGREFNIQTESNKYASTDLQLSSLGWVSFAGHNKDIHIRAYTPAGRGMHLRTPAVLPNITAFRGRRKSLDKKEYSMKKIKPIKISTPHQYY